MAFGKEMSMMGGKSKLKPEGKEKPTPKGETDGEEPKDGGDEAHGKSPFEGHEGKHFHMHHDGLSVHTHGQHEDGTHDGPHEHPDMASAQQHMSSFMGDDGEGEEMPMSHHQQVMGGGIG
jgi:hypothetical protein